MSDMFQEIDAVEALKRLVKLAVGRGYSYAQICEQPAAGVHWNANSLKQFANRRAASRINERVIALAKVILVHFSNLGDTRREVQSDIIKVKEVIVGIDNADIFNNIGNSFNEINNSALELKLPDYMHFCRASLKRGHFVIIKIDIIKSINATAFIMRITGADDQKRVVIGNVSKTITNTYFTGVAYNVFKIISGKEFSKIDFSQDYNIKSFLSDNPIGQEIIAIPNQKLADRKSSVCFSGLGGRGDPISGIGVLLSPEAGLDYGIDPTAISYVRPDDDEHTLTKLMKDNKAITVSANRSDDDTVPTGS